MLNKKKPVLDEREMLEMYRVEHTGLWLMYGLLCLVIIVQLLLSASFAQMAGELAVLVLSSVALIVGYIRHGIWDDTARPSLRGNAVYSLCAALGVAALVTAIRGRFLVGLAVGALMFILCFLLLCAMMAYMRRRQRRQEEELDGE